jgi:DNA-binding XRE family transcriptional regulator
MIKKINKATDFQEYLKEKLKDKEFSEFNDEHGKQLEIPYKILKLRKQAKITQLQLAKKIGTTQSNIARMEKGQQNFTIETLNKIAHTFNKELQVSIN